NNIVALKKCYAHHESSDGFSITTLREINALRVCSTHPNIVNLLEIARTRTTKMKIGNVFLVFEHCQYDLAQILDSYYNYNQKQKHSNSNNRNRISAIEFCHRHNIIHRDIKPSNLLYDVSKNGGQLKLCDFGLSRIFTSTIPLPTPSAPMTPNVVSLWYRAPELLLPTNIITTSIQYSFPIDLWSIGCVIAELLQGSPFLDGKSEIDQLQKMIQTIGRKSEDSITKLLANAEMMIMDPKTKSIQLTEQQINAINDTKLQDLISSCLQFNPNKRPSITQVLFHPYFLTTGIGPITF
ncbi:kinase-like protein, partial [Fragilariopsis cylindrus CCMP1102]